MNREELLEKFYKGIELEQTIKMLSLTDEELYTYEKEDESVSDSEQEPEIPTYKGKQILTNELPGPSDRTRPQNEQEIRDLDNGRRRMPY